MRVKTMEASALQVGDVIVFGKMAERIVGIDPPSAVGLCMEVTFSNELMTYFHPDEPVTIRLSPRKGV